MCTSSARGSARHAGYTLIEVLVAMMILAMSLTVLLRIFSGGLRNISVSADYSRAVLIAEAQLAATGTSPRLEAGSSQGVSDSRFQWTRTIERYSPYAGAESVSVPVNAYAITVAVEWPQSGNKRRVILSSIKLDRMRRGNR